MTETKLKDAMIVGGISDAEMRKRTGLALSTINEIKNGALENYNLNTLYKICKALGKTPNDILDYEDKCGVKSTVPSESIKQPVK